MSGVKGNHTPYHTVENNQGVQPGDYNGKWTGYIVELEGNGEIFTEISSRSLNVPVTVKVTKKEIKIYLK